MTDLRLVSSASEVVGPTTGARESFPPLLLEQSIRRVRSLALVMIGLLVATWPVQGLLQGFFWAEFQDAGQWGPPISILLASLLMYLIAGSDRVSSRAKLRYAIAYEVAVSFGICWTVYWDTFGLLQAFQINRDMLGLNPVAVWMLSYTVFVPTRPRDAIVGLLGSAAATPITYAILVGLGQAPALPLDQLFWLFTFGYLIVATLAYFMARVIYRLGEEVRRARELGSYRLEQRLGAGGMGEVWRARHRMLVRPAAVKLVSPAMLGGDPDRLVETRARFEREAQATAQLQSSHTVELYDYGVADDGRLYYAMELLDGIDLDRLVNEFGPAPAERVIHVLAQACASLDEAHHRGLIHRDIKPGNIFLCRHALQFDVVKVLDFGLAKHTVLDEGDGRLSRTGAFQGTPAFLAPEQARGEENVDGRVDLYALGCVAYWLLTGALVFDAPSPAAMIVAHATEVPAPPSRRTTNPVPPQLEEIVMACLEKGADARPATARDLSERLAGVPLDQPWTRARAEAWWAEREPDLGLW
jgi:serine/threonine-protein kinase